MSYALETYEGDGSTQNFTVSFPYLDEGHVKVRLDGVLQTQDTDYTFLNATTIQFVTAPADGVAIRIRRESNRDERLVDHVDASTVTEETLDKDANQLLYIAQEAMDVAEDALTLDETGTVYDVDDTRIVNVADPVDPQDAATKAYGDANWGGTAADEAAASAVAAAASAEAALDSETLATASATAASASATAAATAEFNANASAMLAGNSETAAEAAQVAAEAARDAALVAETNAETAETNAETAETNAETAATNAATSETNAANSATAAATSATNAANSATAAATAETNAEAAEVAAELAETNAELAEIAAEAAQVAAEAAQAAAETAETNAETAASNASTSATNAANSATSASGSATTATNAANAAATSELNAESAATAAQTAETNAETAETNAETAETNAEAAQAAAETAQAAAEAAAASITGQVPTGVARKLKAVRASATSVTVTADELVVKDSSNNLRLLSSVNVTPAITSSGANGLDTGSEAGSTWYYVWVIYNPTTLATAGLLSTSASAPTMPAGYTYKALVSAVRNDGSSNFLDYQQYGNEVYFATGANILSSGGATSETAITISGFVPSIAHRFSFSARGVHIADGSGNFDAVYEFFIVTGAVHFPQTRRHIHGNAGLAGSAYSSPLGSHMVPNTGTFNYKVTNNIGTNSMSIELTGFKLPMGGE